MVEILNPKNHDVVSDYSVNNVVISNRYISKMIAQVGENEALFELYSDILTYDFDKEAKSLVDTGPAITDRGYESKELYIKRVGDFLIDPPKQCSAAELIRCVYKSVTEEKVQPEGFHNTALVLGMVREDGSMTIFTGDQTKQMVSLTPNDKLIIFSNH